tara:strand:+ start:724 stop:1314 length:591 start_codon:yes stop_codon:yes gene_type:complete
LALSITKISVELREILLNNRPQSLFDISEKGTVPVLQTSDKVLDESMDIIFWSFKETMNLNDYFQNSIMQEELISKNDSEFKKWLDRYKYNERFKEYSIEDCRLKIHNIILNYEKKLKRSKYLINNSIQIADIAIFPFIRQFANVNIEYFSRSYPKMNDWLTTILNSDLFETIMKKYPQWKIGDSPKIINFGLLDS